MYPETKMYTVTTASALRQLCIKNNWFTCGSNEQYEKLFYANENGCPIKNWQQLFGFAVTKKYAGLMFWRNLKKHASHI